MENNMLGEALPEIMGPLRDLFRKLSGKEGREWLEALKRFLRKEDAWGTALFAGEGSGNLAEVAPETMKLYTTVNIPSANQFVAKDHFKVGAGGVKIIWIGPNFQSAFLEAEGWTGKNLTKGANRIWRLWRDLTDKDILGKLGTKAETTLDRVWELLEIQGNGCKGNLLIDGQPNIFYVRVGKDALYAVSCCSSRGGWTIEANPVTNLSKQTRGRQIISH